MVNVNSVLTPFSHPDLVDAFSTGSEQGEADLTELINDGAVFLVNLPQTKFGKEGARYAYLLIKLRFFNMMRERRTRDVARLEVLGLEQRQKLHAQLVGGMIAVGGDAPHAIEAFPLVDADCRLGVPHIDDK